MEFKYCHSITYSVDMCPETPYTPSRYKHIKAILNLEGKLNYNCRQLECLNITIFIFSKFGLIK
jgi:hypothetical protein